MITTDDIAQMPATNGIYIFWHKKKPIYVGKAVNLKARLISHLRASQINAKEAKIVQTADAITIKKTPSDFDAVILEAHLIRKYKPHYNVVWKDDKSFLYIKISDYEKYPKISLVRRENNTKATYFGPFKSSKTARAILSSIRRSVPFCTQKKITGFRCFYSKIGLCNPCPNSIEKCTSPDEKKKLMATYKRNIRRVKSILRGNARAILQHMHTQLSVLSRGEKYEEAIALRSAYQALETLTTRSFADLDRSEYYFEQNVADELKTFFTTYFPDFCIPQRTVFRLECYDASTLFGKHKTASRVVFFNSQSDKSKYRRYKIQSSTKGDVYMIEEVITRRLLNTKEEMPDLIIIDGGTLQLKSALRVEEKLKMSIPTISIVKNPDRIVIGKDTFKTIYFARENSLFTVFRAIRDESHRFAKNYHVALRNKDLLV